VQVVEGREHEDVHVEVRAAPLLQQLEAQHVRLVGEAAQLPAEDGLGRLHPAQLEQGPARLPPGAARLVRVVEDRAPALRAQRVHRRLDDQVVDQPERLASEVRCQPEDEVQPPRHLLAGEGGGRVRRARELRRALLRRVPQRRVVDQEGRLGAHARPLERRPATRRGGGDGALRCEERPLGGRGHLVARAAAPFQPAA